MATVTGLTADRMLAIEAGSVVSGAIDGSGHLILTKHDTSTVDAGAIRGSFDAATTTGSGIVELATSAETITGTDTVRAVTPAGVAAVTGPISTTVSGKQPLDSDLTAIAALTPTANDTMQFIGTAWTNRTPTQVKTTLAIAEADVTNLVTDLAAKQPLDSDLTAIAAIAPANDDVVQRKAGAWTNRTMAQLVTDLAAAGLQPLDSDLTAIAAIAPTNDDIIQRKAGAWINRTLAQLKTDLSLQPLDSDLTAIAALTPSANDTMQFIGGAWTNRTVAQVKTTLAIAESDVTNLTTDLAAKAPLASPAFTGKASFVASVHTPVAVTLSAGHAAVDANAGDIFDVAASANFTLDNPTNPTNGQVIHLRITQDATGSRILTLGTAWNVGTATVVLSTAANKRDHLIAQYHSGASKWDITGFQKGY